jgi:hypothetical protein
VANFDEVVVRCEVDCLPFVMILSPTFEQLLTGATVIICERLGTSTSAPETRESLSDCEDSLGGDRFTRAS